jgi:hypothetical protein
MAFIFLPPDFRLSPLAPGGYRFPADSPIIRFHFLNDDNRRRGIFVEHIDKQISNTPDQHLFLFSGRPVSGDFNVYERHGFPPFLVIFKLR